MKNTNRFQNETGFFIIYCDMSKLTDITVLYYKKMDEMNAKVSKFQEKIAEINHELDDLPKKYAGQSDAFITRERNKLEKKLNKVTNEMDKFIEEKKKQNEDWINTQKKKIQDTEEALAKQLAKAQADAMAELEKEKAKHQ